MNALFTRNNIKTHSILAIVTLLLLAVSGNPANAQDVSLDLAFVTHLDLDLAEQDVFIERTAGSGEVYPRDQRRSQHER